VKEIMKESTERKKKRFEVFLYSEGYEWSLLDIGNKKNDDLTEIRFGIVKNMLEKFRDLRPLILDYLLEKTLGDELR